MHRAFAAPRRVRTEACGGSGLQGAERAGRQVGPALDRTGLLTEEVVRELTTQTPPLAPHRSSPQPVDPWGLRGRELRHAWHHAT